MVEPTDSHSDSLEPPAIAGVANDRHVGRLCAAIVLIVILLGCLPPLLVGLKDRDSTHSMENVALVTSQETWLRSRAGDRAAWLLPTNDTFNRVEKPPMLVWLNFAAWWDLPADATPRTLIHRARLMTIGLGAVMLVAVFWIGCTIGDVRLASIATLIAGTNVFFQHQARTASYDMHFVAWATLAIAAALSAMRPLVNAPPKELRPCRWGRWGAAGLFLGAAWMTKGPLALPVVLAPCAAMIAMIGRSWRQNLCGLGVAIVVAVACAMPWYVFAWNVHDDSIRTWTNEIRQAWKEPQPVYYYLAVFGLMAPWIVWLIGGLVFPFTSSARGSAPVDAGDAGAPGVPGEPGVPGVRRRALLPWIWFVLIFILFTMPGPKQRRYILPILPACALLAGLAWRRSGRPCGEGATNRAADLRIWIHWGLLLVVALTLGPFLAMQAQLVEWGWLDDQPFAQLGWPIAIGMTALLVALTIAGLRWHRRDCAMLALVAGGVWMIVASTIVWRVYSDSDSAVHPIRLEAESVAAQVGDAPLRALRMPKTTFHTKLNEEFRLYYGRLILHVSPDELETYKEEADGPVFVLARAKDNRDKIMTKAGFEPVMDVNVDKRKVQRLWRWPPE